MAKQPWLLYGSKSENKGREESDHEFLGIYPALQIKGWSRKKKEAMMRGDWKEVQRLGWGVKNPMPEHLK